MYNKHKIKYSLYLPKTIFDMTARVEKEMTLCKISEDADKYKFSKSLTMSGSREGNILPKFGELESVNKFASSNYWRRPMPSITYFPKSSDKKKWLKIPTYNCIMIVSSQELTFDVNVAAVEVIAMMVSEVQLYIFM